jgi:diphosphomevalonate decarboxylase
MMNSNPSYILMKPETLEVIERIQDFRENSKIPVCFTLDAGANVHVLFPENFSKEVMTFIEKELAPLCKEGKFIKDSIGEGPKQF